MNAKMVLEDVRKAGGEVVLFRGKLRAKKLDSKSREMIKKHKTDIVRLLTKNKNPGQAKQSPITADGWISVNSSKLKAAGFFNGDLYSRNLPRGIAYLSLWDKPNLTVKLSGNTLYFTWSEPHGQITQTANPEIRRTNL